MQIFIILASVIVILLVLGFPALPILMGIFWFIELIACLCSIFFFVMAIFLLFTKKKKANYVCLEEGEKYGFYAIYEIEGEQYKNVFPTDRFLEKILYNKKEVNVRVFETKNSKNAFDPVTIFIIRFGFFAFVLLGVFLFELIRQ